MYQINLFALSAMVSMRTIIRKWKLMNLRTVLLKTQYQHHHVKQQS